MDDLVKRLRQRTLPFDMGGLTIYDEDTMCHKAADRIEALEAALRDVLNAWSFWQHNETKSGFTELSISIWDAIAALGEKKDGD